MKGATGTQAAALELFDGNKAKVLELDRLVAEAAGFEHRFIISGQTYTRRQDTVVIQALAAFGATAHKIGVDLRLLQHEKEVEEPFEKTQVGSTAMAYKRNPMRCERVCGLSRILMGEAANALTTQSAQWLERTLDDSSARRFFQPEAFLLADAISLTLQNIFEGLVVYPAMINRHIQEELPFMATEEIIMAMVKAGGSRQECHEKIRVHSQAAGRRVKEDGENNDLLDRIRGDAYFAAIHGTLDSLLDPARFIGCAPEQVEEFIGSVCNPALVPYGNELNEKSQLSV